jgi:hypothetical protein
VQVGNLMPLVFPAASMLKVESGLVGQLGKLRAGCLPALGRIANPPQDTILPHTDDAIPKNELHITSILADK